MEQPIELPTMQDGEVISSGGNCAMTWAAKSSILQVVSSKYATSGTMHLIPRAAIGSTTRSQFDGSPINPCTKTKFITRSLGLRALPFRSFPHIRVRISRRPTAHRSFTIDLTSL